MALYQGRAFCRAANQRFKQFNDSALIAVMAERDIVGSGTVQSHEVTVNVLTAEEQAQLEEG